ncbi:putative phage-associated protein [Actinoplanes tereljensis]|nr:type II toxin-antitoxin system antitoxin SocA domain-containing protein [Actinoplanes tereljensis]
MKLEKLVYYCQGWHLARHGVPLFDDAIEAWRQGPVVPALYRQHRKQYTVSAWPAGNSTQLTPAQRETVDWVSAEYGKFSAIELSRMTHSELPWRVARGALPESEPSSTQLSAEIMRTYYARQLADPETAVALATANAALEGVEFDDDWQDRLRDVASGLVSADDLVAEEIARITGG